MTLDDETRYARQLEVFTEEGQRRIGAARVAVLGLGGLGSHVCQQLAYLGARHFAIADDDVVDVTNLNRLIGATEGDIDVSKNVVAERLIKSIQPTADVESIAKKLPDAAIDDALSVADLIMGCFDNDYPRMLTTEQASKHGVPYVDAASGVNVTATGVDFGGRVVVAGLDTGCLSCMGKLDQSEIRRAQMNEDELAAEAKVYGVPVESLRGTGPSVVAVNGVVASLAVVEAMYILAGRDTGRPRVVNYRGGPGWISSGSFSAEPCHYCATWAARRDLRASV